MPMPALHFQLMQQMLQLKESRPDFISSRLALLFEGEAIRLADVPNEPYAELWAEIHWTKKAQDHIRAEEYRYISPEMDLDYTSEKDGNRVGAALLAIGLVNRPFLNGMAPVTLKEGEEVSQIQVLMTGTWYHPWYGKFSVTLTDLNQMVANLHEVFRSANPQSEHPDTEMMVDYNHGSLAYGADIATAAGWVRGKGVYVVHPESQPEPVAANLAENIEQMFATRFDWKGFEPEQLKAFIEREIGHEQPAPQTPPRQGAVAMKDQLIRQILNLATSVEITDDHRSQAFSKLHEDNLALRTAAGVDENAAVEGLVLSVPVTTPESGTLALSRDNAAEHIVLTREQYSQLQTASAAAPKEGEMTLSRADYESLKADATAGADAAKTLKQKEIDEAVALSLGEGKITPAETAGLKELGEKHGIDVLRANLKDRQPVIDLSVRGDNGDDPSTDEVEQFVKAKEAEHIAANKPEHEALSLARRAAEEHFDAETFAAWRNR